MSPEKGAGFSRPFFVCRLSLIYSSTMNDDLFSLPSDIDFSLLRFHLEFQERFRLSLTELLRLRRELQMVASQTLGGRTSERFQALFDPPLPADPVALRRFQRPSPPFAILPHPEPKRVFDAGDRFEIAVSFWGRGGHLVGDFARVLQALGKIGFHRGQGTFELAAIEAEDASGNRVSIWQEGEGLQLLTPPINEVGWWLNRVGEPAAVMLEFLTPARLLSQGRPLFRLDFRRLFPFILRRVTSMLYAHCGREVVDDPGRLLAAAEGVREVQNALCWQDWRTLEGEGMAQDLGGIIGSVRLEGETLQSVFGILRVGSLMNVGKGAAFGAGCFRLRDAQPC
jgi:hypothetical protein